MQIVQKWIYAMKRAKFDPPDHIRNGPNAAAFVRLAARTAGAHDRKNKTPRASFEPWMKRCDYVRGAKNWDGGFRGCRSGVSKWSKRAHYRRFRKDKP